MYEPSSGTILFAKAPDEPFTPGSLVKVMTAATVFDALKANEIRSDQLCKVSEHAWRTGGAPSGRGATMFAAIKSEIAVEDLLKGLLVHNANDAAIVLAECIDGSEEAFAERMTELAHSIGMTNTKLANPTGYAEKPSRTTVRDQARLAQYILDQHPNFYPLFLTAGIHLERDFPAQQESAPWRNQRSGRLGRRLRSVGRLFRPCIR
ncbi:serine hydrolase [Roseibium salinum]|nr:serine hydrolase [Roseibium salinum]